MKAKEETGKGSSTIESQAYEPYYVNQLVTRLTNLNQKIGEKMNTIRITTALAILTIAIPAVHAAQSKEGTFLLAKRGHSERAVNEAKTEMKSHAKKAENVINEDSQNDTKDKKFKWFWQKERNEKRSEWMKARDEGADNWKEIRDQKQNEWKSSRDEELRTSRENKIKEAEEKADEAKEKAKEAAEKAEEKTKEASEQ